MGKVEVLVIGGGATGAGIARDLSLRGREVLLLEKGDFSSGASGSNNGLLHSGARYAINDCDSAKECASENLILKTIAPSCIEDTGGMFVGVKEDAEFADQLLSSCHECNIDASELKISEALSREPKLSHDISAAIAVPDASIDSFQLTLANIEDARRNGAVALNYCKVVGMTTEAARVTSVSCQDARKRIMSIEPEMVVNAGGAWAGEIASLTGLKFPVIIDKGSMVVMNGRLVNGVVNRMRLPSDGDIIVPNHGSSIIGTTSAPLRGQPRVTPSEIRLLVKEAAAMIPEVATSRAIRAYSGLRPLISSGSEGREASRSFQITSHHSSGIENMISVVGGKLTTYRLMAEKTSDLVMRAFGRKRRCSTHKVVLPSHIHDEEDSSVADLACSCEKVSWIELQRQAVSDDVVNLSDLMRRTRAGMGFCQSGLCAFRLQSAIGEKAHHDGVEHFLRERWKGIEPVAYGDQLRQEILKANLFRVYGLEYPPRRKR